LSDIRNKLSLKSSTYTKTGTSLPSYKHGHDRLGVKVFQKKKRPYNSALVLAELENAKDWQERKNYLPDGHGEPGPVTSVTVFTVTNIQNMGFIA